MDLKIYVETDADERILRRAKRDMQERGRDLDSVIDQYLTTVKPMHNTYVKPTRIFADIILNGGKNEQAFKLVRNQIKQILKKSYCALCINNNLLMESRTARILAMTIS